METERAELGADVGRNDGSCGQTILFDRLAGGANLVDELFGFIERAGVPNDEGFFYFTGVSIHVDDGRRVNVQALFGFAPHVLQDLLTVLWSGGVGPRGVVQALRDAVSFDLTKRVVADKFQLNYLVFA